MKKEEIWQMALASGLCDADLSGGLAPCPFCLSNDVENENVYGAFFHVKCNQCHATGPTMEIKSKHNGKWAKEASCDAWNNRG